MWLTMVVFGGIPKSRALLHAAYPGVVVGDAEAMLEAVVTEQAQLLARLHTVKKHAAFLDALKETTDILKISHT
jgi:hypothetical protein